MGWITAYGCTSAAGESVEKLWQALNHGEDHSRLCHEAAWFEKIKAPVPPSMKAYFNIHPEGLSQKDQLLNQLLYSWQQVIDGISEQTKNRLRSQKVGVILASTKGFIDDLIWRSDFAPTSDTMTPLLTEFLAKTELQPSRFTCLSNACTSSISALFLAEQWLKKELVSDVVILAADAVGPFVLQGFQSLRVLTEDKTRPFAKRRSGFFLGEATAAILLTAEPETEAFQVRGIGIDAEGYAVTRPSQSGDSLKRAIRRALVDENEQPDVILAHGTATQVNDAVEDKVFSELFFANSSKGQNPPLNKPLKNPLISATKWCVGHTLATSGALDLIVGCEILKRQKIFSIANTTEQDPDFRSQYLVSGTPLAKVLNLKNFMVTSLGFGGIHGAAFIEAR